MAIEVTFLVRAERPEDISLADWREAVELVRAMGEVTFTDNTHTDQFAGKLTEDNLWDAAMVYRNLLSALESLSYNGFDTTGLAVSDAGAPVAVEEVR